MPDIETMAIEVVPLIQKALHNAHPGTMLEFRAGWLGSELLRQIRTVISRLQHEYPDEVQEDMNGIELFLSEHRAGHGLSYRTLSRFSRKSIVTMKRAAAKGILKRIGKGLYAKYSEAEALPYCFSVPPASRGKARSIDMLWRLLFRDERFTPLTCLPAGLAPPDGTAAEISLPACVPLIPGNVREALDPLNYWDIRLLTAIRLANAEVKHGRKRQRKCNDEDDYEEDESVIELFYSLDRETGERTLLDHRGNVIPQENRPKWQIGQQLWLDGTLSQWAKERGIDISYPAGVLASYFQCPYCFTPGRGTYKKPPDSILFLEHEDNQADDQYSNRQKKGNLEGATVAGTRSSFSMCCRACGKDYPISRNEFKDKYEEFCKRLVSLNELSDKVKFTDDQIIEIVEYTQREFFNTGDNAPDRAFMKTGRRFYHPWEKPWRSTKRGILLAIAMALGIINEDQASNAKRRNVACTSVRNALSRIRKNPAKLKAFRFAEETIDRLAHEIEKNRWADLWFVFPATFARQIVAR